MNPGLIIDLRKGFGEFPGEYKLTKFPDNSIKFELLSDYSGDDEIEVRISFRDNDYIVALAHVKEVLDEAFEKTQFTRLVIDYMMYQQDDMRFDEEKEESFGLKVICKYINSLGFDLINVFHPHSIVTPALLDHCYVNTNDGFIDWALEDIGARSGYAPVWVIPDSGAFKTQFKQIQKKDWPSFVVASKSRDHITGIISTQLNSADLKGQDCFIIDDICLGGRTFIQLADELKKKNCGKLYLIISHGIFNYGMKHLLDVFDTIYTTDSICELEEHDDFKIFKLP